MNKVQVNESVNKILNGGDVRKSIIEAELDKDKVELIHAINDLVAANTRIMDAYEVLEDKYPDFPDLFAEKYPYDKSFDEVMSDVVDWRDSLVMSFIE
jgi:hypothetical protein